jgi:hypothetical protein
MLSRRWENIFQRTNNTQPVKSSHDSAALAQARRTPTALVVTYRGLSQTDQAGQLLLCYSRLLAGNAKGAHSNLRKCHKKNTLCIYWLQAVNTPRALSGKIQAVGFSAWTHGMTSQNKQWPPKASAKS